MKLSICSVARVLSFSVLLFSACSVARGQGNFVNGNNFDNGQQLYDLEGVFFNAAQFGGPGNFLPSGQLWDGSGVIRWNTDGAYIKTDSALQSVAVSGVSSNTTDYDESWITPSPWTNQLWQNPYVMYPTPPDDLYNLGTGYFALSLAARHNVAY